jgi:hypothetical protein
MTEEDSLETPEESTKQRIIADWQAQRLLSRNKLRQLMQEKMNLEIFGLRCCVVDKAGGRDTRNASL